MLLTGIKRFARMPIKASRSAEGRIEIIHQTNFNLKISQGEPYGHTHQSAQDQHFPPVIVCERFRLDRTKPHPARYRIRRGPAGAPYIIVFKDTVDPTAEARSVATANGLQPGFVYQYALKGMSAHVPAERLEALQHDRRVAYIVQDMERSISAQAMPIGIQRIFADTNPEIAINGIDDYRVDVDVAVLDTGVDFQHPDLNVAGGVTCSAPFIFWATCNTGGDDFHNGCPQCTFPHGCSSQMPSP